MLTKRQVMQGGAGVLGAMVIYGVWRDTRSDPLAGRAEHEAGFSVVVPDGFEVRRPAGKLKITNFDHTYQKWIEIETTGSEDTIFHSNPNFGLRRHTPAGQVHFTVRPSPFVDGTWNLRAWLTYATHRISFHAVETSSPDLPGFAFAWRVIGSVRT